MDYQLALALRDADFPQEGKGRFIGPPDKIVWRHADRVYSPTLDELIEACGGGHFTLSGVGDDWQATSGVEGERSEGRGKTKAEAVARLWLALIKR